MTTPRLTEVALFTNDVDGVTAFYERVLGLAPDERSLRHALFTLGEVVFLIHVKVDPSPDGPPGADHVAFSLDTLDDRAASLAEAGDRRRRPARPAVGPLRLSPRPRRPDRRADVREALVFLKHKPPFARSSPHFR